MTHLTIAGQYIMTHPAGILFALVATYVIGSTWHGPMFGKQWMKLNKIPMPKKEDMKFSMMLPGLIANLFLVVTECAVLGAFYAAFGTETITEALVIAAMIWLPFSALLLANIYSWGGKPMKLIILDSAHALVSLMAVAAIVFYTL